MVVKKWRFFPPWRETEQEQWLQEMSRAGLHVLEVGTFGHHSFIPGPSRDLVYRWSAVPSREREQYKQLYLDAGWEIAAVSVGFICWCTPAAAGCTEVFTDSSAKRRHKFQLMLCLGGVATISAIAALPGPDGISVFGRALRAAAAIWFGYAAVRVGWQALTIGRRA